MRAGLAWIWLGKVDIKCIYNFFRLRIIYNSKGAIPRVRQRDVNSAIPYYVGGLMV